MHWLRIPPVLIHKMSREHSLDIVCKQDIMNYLSAYTKSGGTVIITSHEEGELKLADRMYLLKNGKLNELDHPVTGNELLEIIHRYDLIGGLDEKETGIIKIAD